MHDLQHIFIGQFCQSLVACRISVCVSEFLDKLAEKYWRKWKQQNDVNKYADTIGWVTVEIPLEILRQEAV